MFKSKASKDTEMLLVVMDALLAVLDKKGLVTKQEMQDEILLRNENDIVTVGGIEYKVEKDE